MFCIYSDDGGTTFKGAQCREATEEERRQANVAFRDDLVAPIDRSNPKLFPGATVASLTERIKAIQNPSAKLNPVDLNEKSGVFNCSVQTESGTVRAWKVDRKTYERLIKP
jgi:hypothetical protein